MLLIATVHSMYHNIYFEIFQNLETKKYYKRSPFSENVDEYVSMEDKEVCRFCYPKDGKVDIDKIQSVKLYEDMQNKFISYVDFFYYDGAFTLIYGFGDTEEEAIKICKEKIEYFLKINNK